MESYQRETRTLCTRCGALVPATIRDDGPGLAMDVACPECGPVRRPFVRDGRFLRAIEPFVDRRNERTQPDDFRGTCDFIRVARDLYIDVTERCNFDCPICYTNANTQPPPDLTLEEIFTGVDALPPGIVVSLLGGEPTLRKDLAVIVRHITGRGHLVKLITNGTRLTDERIDELYDAGLRWVVLQFDGFSDEIYLKTRGRRLVEERFAVIERLSRRGMIIVLASMIVPGVNDDQVGRILHYALCHPSIVQIGFLPASNIGRNGIDDLEMPAFMDLLSDQTGGRITAEDFVRASRQGDRYTRLTGNLAYKARTCVQGLFLYHDGYRPEDAAKSANGVAHAAELHDGKTLMPIDRALLSGTVIANPGRVGGALTHIARWNAEPRHPHLFGVVIEKFRDRNALDFDDAKNCTKVYLTRDGLIPNCLYNIQYRPRRHDHDHAVG